MRNPEKQKMLRAQKIKKKYLRLSKVLCKYDVGGKCKRSSACGDIKLSELVQARPVQRKWDLEYPVAVKILRRSHVSSCFWMALPVPFCKTYLPKEDTIMVLETESGERYDTKYLPRNNALSGGWKRFAKVNKLVEGDVVIFHLVEATRFKVYIIKEKAVTRVSLPISLCSLDASSKQSLTDRDQIIVYKRRKVVDDGSRTFRLSEAEVHFRKITSFEDFYYLINNLLPNCKLPKRILQRYYKLCCNQGTFLHANLFKGINPRWGDGVIGGTVKTILSKTVSIASSLRNCKLSKFLEEFALWDRYLNIYEALGMNVGFLQVRLHHLQNLAFSSEGAMDRRKYIEASYEHARSESEVKKLEAILAELRKVSKMLGAKVVNLESKAASKRYSETCKDLVFANDEIKELEVLVDKLREFLRLYDDVIETLKSKARNHELMFQEEVSAPW